MPPSGHSSLGVFASLGVLGEEGRPRGTRDLNRQAGPTPASPVPPSAAEEQRAQHWAPHSRGFLVSGLVTVRQAELSHTHSLERGSHLLADLVVTTGDGDSGDTGTF